MANPGTPSILFINDHLGHRDGAWHGVTRWAVDVLPRVDPTRFAVSACFLRAWHPAAEELTARGVPSRFLDRAPFDPRALRDIVRLVRQDGIDLLHLGGNKSMLLGRHAARSTACSAIIHLHDSNPIGPLLGLLQRRAASLTDRALAVSAPVASVAREAYGIPADRVEILPNGVDLNAFAPRPAAAAAESGRELRDELALDPARPVVGIVGRITADKGQALTIRVWSSVLERVPAALLLIVGEGPDREACAALVRELGVDAAVRFTGQRGDVPALLSVMQVLAVPSKEEGFGYSALEGMAAGLPVVGFRVGGLESIVSDGKTGFLVDPGVGPALASALVDVLSDRDLRTRLGQAAALRAEAFSLEKHVRRLEAIYEAVLRAGENP